MPKSRGSKPGPGQAKGKGKTTSTQEEEADADNPVRASKRARREKVIFDPSPTEKDEEGEVGETTEDLDTSVEPINCQELFNAPMSANCTHLHEKITTNYPKLDMILKIKCSKSEVDCSKYKPVLTQDVSSDQVTNIGETNATGNEFCEDVPILTPDKMEPSIPTISPPARSIIEDLKEDLNKSDQTSSSTITEKTAQESPEPHVALDLPKTDGSTKHSLTSSSSLGKEEVKLVLNNGEESVKSVLDNGEEGVNYDDTKVAVANSEELSRTSKRNITKKKEELKDIFSKKSENLPIRMKLSVKSRSSSFSDDPSSNTASVTDALTTSRSNHKDLDSAIENVPDSRSDQRESYAMSDPAVDKHFTLELKNVLRTSRKNNPKLDESKALLNECENPPIRMKLSLKSRSSSISDDLSNAVEDRESAIKIESTSFIKPTSPISDSLPPEKASLISELDSKTKLSSNQQEICATSLSSGHNNTPPPSGDSNPLPSPGDSNPPPSPGEIIPPPSGDSNPSPKPLLLFSTMPLPPQPSESREDELVTSNKLLRKMQVTEPKVKSLAAVAQVTENEMIESSIEVLKDDIVTINKDSNNVLETSVPINSSQNNVRRVSSVEEKPAANEDSSETWPTNENSELPLQLNPSNNSVKNTAEQRKNCGRRPKRSASQSKSVEQDKPEISDKAVNPKQLREIHCTKCHAEVPTKIALQLHTCYSIMDQIIQTDGATSRKRPEMGLYNVKGRRKSNATDAPEKVSTESIEENSNNVQIVPDTLVIEELNSPSASSDTAVPVPNDLIEDANETVSSPPVVEPVVNTPETVIESTLHQPKDSSLNIVKQLESPTPAIVIDEVNVGRDSIVAVINDGPSSLEVPHVSDMVLTSPGACVAASNEPIQAQALAELTVPPDLEDEFARISPNLQPRREDLTLNVLPSALQFEEEDASSELTTPESFSDSGDLSSQIEDASEKEVELFHKARQLELVDEIVDSDNNVESDTASSQKKKRGRPKGSKNKAKDESDINKESETNVASNCQTSEAVPEHGVENKEITAVIRGRGKQKGRGKGSLSSTPSSGSPNITSRSISPSEPNIEQGDVPKVLPVKRKGDMTENNDVKEEPSVNVNVKENELKRSNPITNKKDSNVSDKTGKKRKRIVKMSDSEDSSVSTDSPLKPKTYKNAFGSRLNSPQVSPCSSPKNVPKQSKSKKKALHNHELSKMVVPVKTKEDDSDAKDSPVEELPLVPRSYHAQKKELDKVKNEELKKSIQDGKVKEQVEVKNLEDVKVKNDIDKEKEEIAERKEVAKKLKSFRSIEANNYLCPRKINKQSKKMQCDCTLSQEEIENGEKGCGSDCLNKMLYIECGKGCSLGDLCTNKRFQKIQNAPCEVFKTSWKGFGIRALSDFSSGTFIMEYVGEVLDPRQFRKRAKQYSNDDVQHFYFMALSKDFCVDATLKGNISRFINHSCDPNSETQKWTVNGELRVGFFTRRHVPAGEELTFDYKYERYGQQAQRCYCNSYNCRGWLGGEPGNDQDVVDDVEDWSSSEEEEIEDIEVEKGEEKVEAVKEEKKKEKQKKEKEKKRRKKTAGKIKNFEAEEFEEEIERFQNTGIRNKMQAIGLNRLMIRASGLSTKTKLANLLLCADKPCKRLFIDYQGPQILKSWMSELNWSLPELDLKLLIETILSELSFPHKTMLKDSGLYKMVEKWRIATPLNDKDEEDEDKDAFMKKSNSPNNSRASSPRSSRPGSPKTSRHGSPRSSKANSPRRSGPCTPPSISQSGADIKGEEDMDIDEEDESHEGNIELPNLLDIPVLPLFHQRGFSPEPLPPGVSPPGSPQVVEEEEVVADAVPEKVETTLNENQEEIGDAKMLIKDVSVSAAIGGDVAQVIEAPVQELEVNQIPQLETRGENVAETLSGQADVVQEESAEVDSEVLGGGVEPVGREEVPGTEEERREDKEIDGKVTEIQRRAKELIKVWALLQEVFKIPKKERHKMRVEHEREADRSGHGDYRRLVGMVSNLAQLGSLQEAARSYAAGEKLDLRIGRPSQPQPRYADGRGFPDSRPPQRGERGYSGYGGRAQNSAPAARSHLPGYSNERSRGGMAGSHLPGYSNERSRGGMAGSPLTRERRNLRLDDQTGRLMMPHLNKEDRRMLFAAKIEEEERQKKTREALTAMHSQACRLLCLDPAVTPMFKKYPEFYFDSTSNQWIPMPSMTPMPDDWEPPLMARLPPEAYRPDDEPLPNPLDIYPPGICPIEPEPPQPVITPQVNVETFEDICAYYEEMYRLRREQSPDDEFAPVEKDYRSPSPCPEFRRRDRSKDRARAKSREGVRGPRTPSSSPERRIITRRSESLSPVPLKGPRTPPSPLRSIADIDWGLDDDRSPSPLPLSFGEERIITHVELSPGNYRSPSPVQWSPRPTASPALLGTKLPSFNPVTGLPDNPFFPIKPDPNPSPTPTPTSIPFLDSDPKHEVAFASEPEPQPQAEPEPEEARSHPGYYTSPAKSLASQGGDKQSLASQGADKLVLDSAIVTKTKTAVSGIYTATVTTERVEDIIVKLPSKWKMARDSEGRAYYYHSQTKAVQWEPPTEEQLAEEEEDEETREEREEKIDMETASTDSEGEEDRSEDGDDTDTEDDSEEDETTEGTDSGDVEDGEIPDSDLSASEKKMLLRMRRRTKEERQLSRRQKKERDKERREGERQWLRERHKRHRAKGLVEEHIIPARITDKDKVDLMTFKEMRERLLHKDEIRQQQEREEREEEEADRREKDRREKAKRAEEKRAADKARRETDAVKFQQLVDAGPTQQQQTPVKTPTKHSKTKDTTTAAADTSSDVEKKYKDKFVKEISKTIVKILDPYRRKGVKGYISTTEDFKHLAKKLTYSIMQKEMKQCKAIEELKASDKVKKKAAEYVQKYMKRYESEYQRSPVQPH